MRVSEGYVGPPIRMVGQSHDRASHQIWILLCQPNGVYIDNISGRYRYVPITVHKWTDTNNCTCVLYVYIYRHTIHDDYNCTYVYSQIHTMGLGLFKHAVAILGSSINYD